MVIGTTGLTVDDETKLAATVKGNSVVYCANTSVGVTLLTQLVEQVAAKLTTGWDIEILETHHHHKLDAPSGTALALGKAAARSRHRDFLLRDSGSQLTIRVARTRTRKKANLIKIGHRKTIGNRKK